MQAGEGITLVARAGADTERRALVMMLVLACADQQAIEAIEADPSLESGDLSALRLLLPAERRARRKGEVSPSRSALARRLLAMETPSEADLRQILDEASSEEIPRALCAPWLRFHALRLAREAIGEVFVQIAAPAKEAPLDPAVLAAIDGWLTRLPQDGGAPPPPELLAQPVPERLALLQASLDRDRGSMLRKLGRMLAQIGDPALAVPLLCAAQRVSDYRARYNLCAGVSRSPFAAPLVALQWDADPQMDQVLSPQQPNTALTAFLCAELWQAPARPQRRERIWKMLAALREPVALAEQIRFGGIDPTTGLAGYFGRDSMSDHPRAAEALLRIVLRRDERLEELWSQTRGEWDDSRSNLGIWRCAADVLPDVLAANPPPPSARRSLAEKLRRDQASGEPREDLYRLALSLARIGDPSGLYLLLEEIDRSEVLSYSLSLALRALGPAAHAAIPALKARADQEWALLTLAALEPERPEWAERLLSAIADPSLKYQLEAKIEQYFEGLVTRGEIDGVLCFYLDAAQILRVHDGAALRRASAHLVPVIEAHKANLPELAALLGA